MDIKQLPYQIMDMLSDAVAVMDQNGVVVYTNGAFQRLYNPLYDPAKKTPCQELQNLNLRFLQSGKVFTSERVLVPPIGKKFEVFVYSLDRRGQTKDFNLVLVKIEGHRTVPEFTMAEELVNSYINEQKILSEKLAPEFRELKGDDSAFKMALINAQKAARTDLPVLVFGESGTGKEVLARAIHLASYRKKKPFVDINCAAIPDNLIESELFGYERGAFTGARREGKMGLFDQAHEGSIFMDEIGDASPQTQSKILRVLQEGQFKRIGGSANIQVDVRLISATNKDLSTLIAKGEFREDLFYRLNTITINLPPLSERQTDIRLLVNHFLMEYAEREGRNLRFSPDSMELLECYEWPGNVRELKGVVDYAATMATGSLLTPDSLPSFLYAQNKPRRKKNRQSDLPYFMAADRKSLLTTVLRQVERNLIKKVLERSKTKTEAIKTLGISRRTFYAKIKQYDLE
jgi:transcriptional regulator with PAS, ATPase and Fis domain